MLLSLAGAMSTAELGKSLSEMIRQNKVHIISCTGANLEEDLMNTFACLSPAPLSGLRIVMSEEMSL